MVKFRVKSLSVMSPSQTQEYSLLLIIGFFLTLSFLVWWFQPSNVSHSFSGYGHIFDLVLFTFVSYVVWYQIINECFSWFVSGKMKQPVYSVPKDDLKVAFLTAFVPDKEPYDILERTLAAMVKADYPHDTWVLDEGNDEIAKSISRKLGVNYFTRFGSEKYNTLNGPYKMKTKGGNYNAWFDKYGSGYEIVAQLDVDFVPKQNYLTKVLGYFTDPTVAFVGTPQIYGNTRDSWIVRGAAEQAYNFYGSMQKGFYGMDMTLFIGANHALRVSAHNDIDGYSGHIVEDHLTGMKFYSKKWKSVYVPEILAVGEGPSTWDAYFGQQMRWAYGLIDILFRHSPKIFPSMKKVHILNYFLLQQYYFYGLAQVIGILLLCLYFFFGIQTTPMDLMQLLILYLPLIVFQQVFFIWLQKFNVDPKNESGLMLRGRILSWAAWPIYFLAFVGVLIGRKLNYVVTPKGKIQNNEVNLSLFLPHFFLGTVTLFCLAAAYITGRHAPLLIFWALVNTFVMYSFPAIEAAKKINRSFIGASAGVELE